MIDNRKKQEKCIRIGSFSLLLFIIGFIIYISIVGKTDDIKLQSEELMPVSEQWLVNGEIVEAFPATITVRDKVPTMISCTLPDKVYDTDAIFYDAQFVTQHVYVEDELIYSFAEEPVVPFGDLVGSAYVIAPLKEEYAGKTLTIEMTSLFGQLKTEFQGFYIGSAGEFKYYILSRNVWRMICVVAFLVLSVTMFFIGIMHMRTLDARYNGFAFVYFSLMTSSVSAWILSDSSLVQIFSNKTMVGQVIAFTSLICVACFYMGLCSCLIKERRMTFMLLEYAGYILLGLMIILYIADISDPARFMPVIAVYMIGCLFFSFIRIILSWKSSYYVKLMGIGNLILLIGVSIAMIQYGLDPAGSNIVVPITTSFGLYIVLLFVILMNYERRIIKKSSVTKVYEKLAFTDQLTGLGNRAFYEKTVDDIEARKDIRQIMFFMGDLNFLKKTNDTLGHERGDELIKAAAECFAEVFNENHNSFRMGGDEFAAILVNAKHNPEYYYSKLRTAIDKKSKEKNINLSIAISHSECDYTQDSKDIRRELYHEADAKMYEVKKKMKAFKENE